MREHVAAGRYRVLVAVILRHVPHEAGMPELASGRARRAEAVSAQPLATRDVIIDWAEIERRFGNKAAFVTRLAGTALELRDRGGGAARPKPRPTAQDCAHRATTSRAAPAHSRSSICTSSRCAPMRRRARGPRPQASRRACRGPRRSNHRAAHPGRRRRLNRPRAAALSPIIPVSTSPGSQWKTRAVWRSCVACGRAWRAGRVGHRAGRSAHLADGGAAGDAGWCPCCSPPVEAAADAAPLCADRAACAGADPRRRRLTARVPAGFWLQDLFGFARNPYDRIGHFFQGFVPAICSPRNPAATAGGARPGAGSFSSCAASALRSLRSMS